jgi:hypothetical protein
VSIARSAMETKIRIRIGDETTRRDGTAITSPRYSATKLQAVINNSIRSRQPLVQGYDKSWYMSVLDFVGVTDAIASSSSTTLPIVANEQYAAPSNVKQVVRLARRDLTGFPTVRKVDYHAQDQIYYGGTGFWSGLYASYPENLSPSNETWSWVTSNAGGTLANRVRILPAPASTSYLYRLWFQRVPTEPSADGHTLDLPPDFVELIALDAAIELAGTTSEAVLGDLIALRNIELQARADDYKNRFAGPHVLGDVRL